MTKDDIIKLAKQAGLFVHKEVQPEFIAFAALVAAHKAEVALAEAYRCGYEAGVVAEREACAKLIEAYPEWIGNKAKQEIAAAIRAYARTTP